MKVIFSENIQCFFKSLGFSESIRNYKLGLSLAMLAGASYGISQADESDAKSDSSQEVQTSARQIRQPFK